MTKIINPINKIHGIFKIPGDKSISHRAIMFGAISEGITEVTGFLTGDDCLSTIDCFRKLGVKIEQNCENVKIYGNGLRGLSKPEETLYVGNSGTTIRLISGILCGQSFSCEITGDESIQKRPMDRIIIPLEKMGAKILGSNNKNTAPLSIKNSNLKGITYKLPVASAQIKSAILLASLYSDSPTTVIEKEKTRDHTEILLKHLGANISVEDNKITSYPPEKLTAKNITIPADISSAAFFIVSALILPNSHVFLENIGVNETRTGIITALMEMGADIKLLNQRSSGGEPVADIEVKSSSLKGITIKGDIIPKMIDEIPIFTIAALFADGQTIVKDAAELKVKESNRINAMVTELKKMGAIISETDDGMIITGGTPLNGANFDTYNDHRIAMSLSVAGLKANSPSQINNSECVDISFPNFYELLCDQPNN